MIQGTLVALVCIFLQDMAVNVSYQGNSRHCGTKRRLVSLSQSLVSLQGWVEFVPWGREVWVHFSFRWPADPLVQERAGSLSGNDGWSIMCGPSYVIYSEVILFLILILLHQNMNLYFIQITNPGIFYLYYLLADKYVLSVTQDLTFNPVCVRERLVWAGNIVFIW